MLTIVDRLVVVRFARLQDERIAASADDEGLHARHQMQVDNSLFRGVSCRQHLPIGDTELGFATNRPLVAVL